MLPEALRFWDRKLRKIPYRPELNTLMAQQAKKDIMQVLSARDEFPKMNMVVAENEGMPPIIEQRWGVEVAKKEGQVIVATPFELAVGQTYYVNMPEGNYEEIPVFKTLEPLPTEMYTPELANTARIAVINKK